MKIHSLTQGTPSWHAHRATHFNASDAPAMAGCSPYKTRSQLLHELHTGLTPDVDAATQARFDEGHRIESMARTWAEENIFDGQFLYPLVGSEGKYSASFDGLIDDYSEGFEHKTLNAELRELIEDDDFPGDKLPMVYRVQMEQQLMVSGAKRILFMASTWDKDTLIDERHCWYMGNTDLRLKIIAGWQQFAKDLEVYTPPATVAEVVGRTPETLPALHIVMRGEVSASNLAEFKEVALSAIRSVNRDLKTDQDFADSAKARAWCSDIESRVAAAKSHAMSQTKSIDDLFRALDEVSAEAKDVRLALEKLEKARKESRRGEIVAGGIKALSDHVAALNKRLAGHFMPATVCDFGGAIKGLRTFDSMQNAVDTALANAKIAASATADKIEMNLCAFHEAQHAFLFNDRETLVLKEPEYVEVLIKNRIREHKAAEAAKEEAQRERIRAEEQAKAERAARAKLAEEHAAADKLVRQRIAQELDAAVQAREVAFDAIEAAKAVPVPAQVPAQPEWTLATAPPCHQTVVSTPPTMPLGKISERLGFNVTSAFLASLGFEATTVKAAKLFHTEDFPAICRAIVKHIESVCELQAA